MAGLGSRFANAGYEKIKPLIDVDGATMIERVVDNLRVPGARFVFIARREHEADLASELLPRLEGVDHDIVYIDLVTEGAACTVLHARPQIQGDAPLVIANSDQIIDASLADFVDDCLIRDLDGSIMTFECPDRDPKWSFARTDEHGRVTEVREKVAISSTATVGIYLFRRGSDFVNGALDMIVRNERVNGEFYVCPVYNQLIRQDKSIGIWDIPMDAMHGIGTPRDLDAYLEVLKAGVGK